MDLAKYEEWVNEALQKRDVLKKALFVGEEYALMFDRSIVPFGIAVRDGERAQGQAQDTGDKVRVSVSGKTFDHKAELKAWGLHWTGETKSWTGMVDKAAQADFEAFIKKNGMSISVG